MTNIEIGKMAEEIALQYELLRLDPSVHKYVKSVSDKNNLGFDIQSVDNHIELKPRYIEVKTSNESGTFFLTERERVNLAALGDSSWIYLVNLTQHRIDRMIQDPIAFIGKLPAAVNYRVKI